MNLLVSVGYINHVKYYQERKCLTFRLWHKKEHFLYCYVDNQGLVDFIKAGLEKGSFVTIQGFVEDYIITKDNTKFRSYCVVVNDIQFITPYPNKQFDIRNNKAYRNWRMMKGFVKEKRNEREEDFITEKKSNATFVK